MMNAKSILDNLLGGVAGAGSGLAVKARDAWQDQTPLAQGAVAGGLLGVLLSGNARRLIGSGIKIGGAALIGGLAYQAYQNWKSGKPTGAGAGLAALPAPEGSEFQPVGAAANDLAERLLQAMVAAAKSDGHVTLAERRRIDGQLARLGLAAEAQALIAAELDSALDVGRIAALARSDAEAAQIYAASLLVVDPDGPAERGYLALLADRLNLDPGLVAHIHGQTSRLV